MSDFNISAKDILAEDTLVRDVFENTTKGLCSLKLRTNVSRVPTWIDSLLGYFNQKENASTKHTHSNTSHTIRVKQSDARKSALTIQVYPSTGCITIQGDKPELLRFESEFDAIKRWQPSAPTDRPTPSVNCLMDAAEIEISQDVQVTPQLTIPKPTSAISPRPGPSGIEGADQESGQTQIGRVTPNAAIRKTPVQPNPSPRPTPNPRKKAIPPEPASKCDSRCEKLENELLRMDKRMSDQLQQFREFIEEALVNRADPTSENEQCPQSFLPEEVRLREDSFVAELTASREKNVKLEGEIKRLSEEIKRKDSASQGAVNSLEARVHDLERERISTAQVMTQKDALIHSLKSEISSLRNGLAASPSANPTLQSSPSAYQQRPFRNNEEHAENAVRRNAWRADRYSWQDERRPTLRHLIRCDSHSRRVNPREVGRSIRISTAGGDTIRKTTDFIRRECEFEPTESASFHVGINTILQNQNMREKDLINMVMGEYDDLIEATKMRFPTIKRINLSEVFTLGPSREWSQSTRAALNTTIRKVNSLLSDMAATDPRLHITRHDAINRNDETRARDGLHLNMEGIDFFTADLSRSLDFY